METQTIINILLGLTSFFFGIWVRGLSDSLKELRIADRDLVTRVQAIEILVAGTYVKRDDMDKLIDKLSNAIFSKLDRIETKIDNKVDKE